jgi:hypothetical protein
MLDNGKGIEKKSTKGTSQKYKGILMIVFFAQYLSNLATIYRLSSSKNNASNEMRSDNQI